MGAARLISKADKPFGILKRGCALRGDCYNTRGGNLKSDQEEQNSLDGDGDRKNQTIALKTDQKDVTMKRRLAQDKSMMELLKPQHQSSSVIHN